MPISMTGYGRAQFKNEEWEITAVIQSVNHRFLDLQIHLDPLYSFLELPMREFIKKQCARGKIDITMNIRHLNIQEFVKVDDQVIQSYCNEAKRIQQQYHLNDSLSVNTLMQMPNVFKTDFVNIEETSVLKTVMPIFEQALVSFLEMRRKEGEALTNDLCVKLDELTKLIAFIEDNSQAAEKDYLLKLKEKISSLLDISSFDESRVLMEAAVLAERSSIDEETVRLRSHVNQFYVLLQKNVIGRKGEFILQEMNREVNTIGSKVMRLSFTNSVIEMKAILEKMREQIQNIE